MQTDCSDVKEIIFDVVKNIVTLDLSDFEDPKDTYAFSSRTSNCSNMLKADTLCLLGTSPKCYTDGSEVIIIPDTDATLKPDGTNNIEFKDIMYICPEITVKVKKAETRI